MKVKIKICVAVIVAAVMASCSMFTKSDETQESPLPPIPEGMGRLAVSISDEVSRAVLARTALPDWGAVEYAVTCTPESGPSVAPVEPPGWTSAFGSIILASGTWTISVDAYTILDPNNPDVRVVAGTGIETDVVIRVDTENSVTIRIDPIFADADRTTGTLKYTITRPDNALEYGPSSPVSIENVDTGTMVSGLWANWDGDSASASSDEPLPPGVYMVSGTASNTVKKVTQTKTSVVHIYAGLITRLTHAFTENDFLMKIPVTGRGATFTPSTGLAGKITDRRIRAYSSEPAAAAVVADDDLIAQSGSLSKDGGSANWTIFVPSDYLDSPIYIRQEIKVGDEWAGGSSETVTIPLTQAGAYQVPNLPAETFYAITVVPLDPAQTRVKNGTPNLPPAVPVPAGDFTLVKLAPQADSGYISSLDTADFYCTVIEDSKGVQIKPVLTTPDISTFTMPADDVTVQMAFVNATRPAFEINAADDIARIGIAFSGAPLNASYELMADITLDNWTPIGANIASPFTGNFYGNNHTITIKKFDSSVLSSSNTLGLFGYASGTWNDADITQAVIKDLTVVYDAGFTADLLAAADVKIGGVIGSSEGLSLANITVTGRMKFTAPNAASVIIGGIIGDGSSDTIVSCISDANIDVQSGSTAASYIIAGGVAGREIYSGGSSGTSIQQCSFTGRLTAKTSGSTSNQSFVGGIMGTDLCGLSECVSTGSVSLEVGAGEAYAGGITGQVQVSEMPAGVSISFCSSTGDVTCKNTGNDPAVIASAGGIAGYNRFMINKSYSRGAILAEAVNGKAYAGGIAGRNTSGVQDSYSRGTITAHSNKYAYVGGIVGENTASITQCYASENIVLLIDNPPLSAAAYVAGGIAGKTAGEVTNCAALNSAISSNQNDSSLGRVVGIDSGTASDNIALDTMTATKGPVTNTDINFASLDEPGMHGAGIAASAISNPATYTSKSWDFVAIWMMGADGYPELQPPQR
jgi:hypothetical protein